jgi:hypothetical protein
MAQPNPALTPPDGNSSEALPKPLSAASPEVSPEVAGDDTSWRDVVQLLRRAAQLAAERGAETELFMQAAWTACLDARPGLREEIADKELRAQLKKLRKRGLIASA